MYELNILSFLMRGPMHGYLIAKIINDAIGPFAKVSNGRFYPLLTTLEANGLIAETDQTPRYAQGGDRDRRQRTFAITDAGRKRFHQLMMDTASNPGEYKTLFWMKVPFLDFLPPSERLHLLDHYLNYCQTHIFHLTGEMSDFEQRALNEWFMNAEWRDATLHVFRHTLAQWELELEHARSLRAREGGASTGGASTGGASTGSASSRGT